MDTRFLPIEELDATQAVDKIRKSFRENQSSSSSNVPALNPPSLTRVLELLPLMDPVLVVRAGCAVFSRSHPEMSDFVDQVLVRMTDLGLQQLARLLFAVANSKSITLSMRYELLTEGEKFVFTLLSSEIPPPRVLSKLCVVFSQSSHIWPILALHVSKSLDFLEGDQVQQILFACTQQNSASSDITLSLIKRSVSLSPLSCPKTYSALLISMGLLNNRFPQVSEFCSIYRAHFGIPLRGFIAVEKLRESLVQKGYQPTEIQLRQIRNTLRDV